MTVLRPITGAALTRVVDKCTMSEYVTTLSFKITGLRALAKERPRTGKSGHVYTPKRTKDYEQLVKAHAIAALPNSGYSIPTGPVWLDVYIVDKIPKSWSAEKKGRAARGEISPNKGDLDNRNKAISDALNGIGYLDDKQICKGSQEMVYGAEDFIAVTIRARVINDT